jgi:hypothetical protein
VKEFILFKNKIPDEVLERVENLTSIMLKAEAEKEEHPDDKQRADNFEISLHNSFNMVKEVYGYFEAYKEQNPNDESLEVCQGVLMKWTVVIAWLMGLVPADTISSILNGTDECTHNKKKKKKKQKNIIH